MARAFTEMEKTCLEHSQGKAPKIKPLDASAAKKSKAELKEEEKLAKKKEKEAAISPAKQAKLEEKAQKKLEKLEKKQKKLEESKNGIKKPLSAYMLYCNHRRPIIMKESPGTIFANF